MGGGGEVLSLCGEKPAGGGGGGREGGSPSTWLNERVRWKVEQGRIAGGEPLMPEREGTVFLPGGCWVRLSHREEGGGKGALGGGYTSRGWLNLDRGCRDEDARPRVREGRGQRFRRTPSGEGAV